jgi:cyanophycinase-like exopeptidase
MSGPIALHGGGEFLAGDEPFLAALLWRAVERAGRPTSGRPIRIAVVPTAAARGRPDLAGSNGVEAFERVAAASSLELVAATVPIVNRATAADAGFAAELAAADVIHFPGGDPDLIPTIMPGTAAWAAINDAHDAGAVLVGASAGAMAFGPWTWTPGGGMAGLHVVRGLVVVPHAQAATWSSTIERFAAWAPEGLGALGLSEQTGVIEEPLLRGSLTIDWRVVGPGEARWLADPERGETVVARWHEIISTPVVAL